MKNLAEKQILQFAFVTVHPRFIESFLTFGIGKTAVEKGIAEISVYDLRDFSCDKHGSVDDSPYGGGDGMVLRADCLARAIDSIFATWGHRGEVIYTRPGEEQWTHTHAASKAQNMQACVFVCGRFGGIDERFVETYVTSMYSIGDYVLAGGELACLSILESTLRFVPGVLGHKESAHIDSFAEGINGGLEAPLYTRPQVWNGHEVPSVLTSGNHIEIERWREQESLKRTLSQRPDLIRSK